MNFVAQSGPENQNRALGLAVVVVFHALLIWGLMNGLARKAIELLPEPIETKIIEQVKPKMEEPPPPVPEFEPPPPAYVPPPEIVIATPVTPPPTTITQVTQVKPPPGPPAPPAAPATAPVRVAPRIDLKNSPRGCREPEYPSASERLGESGTSGISLLVGADGKVTQSRVDTTSGSKRLDAAAIKAFSLCKFIVGTNGGAAESSWFSIRYKWVVPE